MAGVGVREFRVGEVLLRGLRILAHNFAPFALLALAFTAPPFVYAWVSPVAEAGAVSLGGIAIRLVDVLLTYLLTAALVYGTVRELRGSRASLAESVNRGLALVFPVIGVAVVAGIATAVGSLLLVVPGLIVASMLWVAVPVAVIERPGVFASLRRSVELTKGKRWQVFAIIVIIFVFAVAVASVMATIIDAVTSSPTVVALMSWVVTAMFTALGAVVSAVSYHDLRIAKEGGDARQIAAAFD